MSGQRTYAISNGRAIKVGRAHDIRARLATLQTANPERLKLVATHQCDIESFAHARLEEQGVKRLSGEWFEQSEFALNELGAIGFAFEEEFSHHDIEMQLMSEYQNGWQVGKAEAMFDMGVAYCEPEEHW